MSKAFQLQNAPTDGVREILRFLLDNQRVSGVFCLRNTGDKGAVDYLFTDRVDELDSLVPLYPLMPVNAGAEIARIEGLDKPAVAILRPCEIRAFVELIKREQGSLDNFLILSPVCGGVLPTREPVDADIAPKVEDYWKSVNAGELYEGIRDNCQACERFVPENADIVITTVGEEESRAVCLTERGESALEALELPSAGSDIVNASVEKLQASRRQRKEKLYKEIGDTVSGLQGLVHQFGRCVGCHGCSRVCPICYCVLCDFESFNYEYKTPVLEREAQQKKGLRLPPDTILFHLGRLNHMSFSCVGCGQCSEVCPADIPVAMIFQHTGEATAKIFDYQAGRSVDEPIPVRVFKEEEFPEIGEE